MVSVFRTIRFSTRIIDPPFKCADAYTHTNTQTRIHTQTHTYTRIHSLHISHELLLLLKFNTIRSKTRNVSDLFPFSYLAPFVYTPGHPTLHTNISGFLFLASRCGLVSGRSFHALKTFVFPREPEVTRSEEEAGAPSRVKPWVFTACLSTCHRIISYLSSLSPISLSPCGSPTLLCCLR